ncbi:MAG TPA: hypothetical protein DEG44_02330, partial [Candidatus Kerfeldbacteria bacterium]|nr:hypothetical protein [Candidatus Kerfeldbacteria bacterium]
PELSLLYKREKVPLERNLFSVTDRFLLPQPPEVLDALAQFSSEQQTDIALAWQLQPHVHWPDILLDHDAPTIIDVILVFPNIEAYSVKADRQAVLNIAEKFSPTEQQTAYEKAGKPVGTWDDIYTYLVVASFPESTTEQIQLLNSEQWQYITLAVLAYGADHVQQLWTEENLLDLKEFDERASSRYYRRDASPAQVLDFIKSLSAVVKSHLPSEVGSGWGLDSPTRPGHSIFNSHGFQGLPEAIAQFQTALYRVPSSRHDALFTVLKQDKYYSGSYNWEHLTEEQVDHFVQYIEITGAQAKVQLDVLISQQKAFTGDRWQLIEQGIQTCQDQGLVIAETDGYDLSGRLAIYERAGTPEQAMTNKFWRQCQEGATAYSTQKGTHAKEYAARERQPGSIINVQQFAEFHQKYFTHNIDAVARLLNLNDTERQIVRQWPQFDATVDLPVIEGIVVHLGSDLTRLDDQTRQRLDQFIALTDDQQKRFLWLDKHIFWLGGNHQGDHAELIFSLAQSAQGEQVQQFLETTGLTGFMPEATLAMVKRPDCAGLYYYLNKEKIQYDQQKVIVGQLITLRDASFPREYDRAGYSAEGNLNTYGEYDGKSSIGHLLEWDPPQLVELARLAIDRHQVLLVELLKLDPIMTREQYLRLLDLAAAERTTHLEYYRDPTQAEIDLIAQRCTLAEQLTGLTLDYSRVSRLKHLSATVWQRLESNSTILGLYLTGQAGSFPEVGLVLPDELLQQPGVWKYNYPAAIWADPEKMRAALVVQERLATAQIKLEPYNAPWEQWVQAQLQAPWLFSGESLACFRTNCDVRLLPQFIELTESDWQTIMPAMMHHHLVYHNDTVEFIERWRNHILLSDEQLSELHRVVETIPWENEDRNPAAWEKARIAFLRKQVEADLPTFAKYVDDSISFWQDIVQLPRSVLRNLEQLSPCTKYVNRYHEQLKNFIATAEHPNFTLVLPLLLQKEHLLPIRLLDRLTPAIMERLQTWPDKLEINYADAADFLADPRAEEILDFAQALRQIFGENFRMSVCDLLIMDVEQDLANLRQLQKDCTLPVTPDHLRRLAPVTSGDMQRTITKLLAMFDYSYKIDFHESVQQLAALDSHLRVAVILAKGSGNFGWGILPYRQELIDTLALTAEQVDELTRACYKSDPGNMPAIDTPAALALLKEPECMAAVLNKYNGEPSAILGEVYSQPAALIKLAYDSWNTVPEYIKQDRQFWELMLEQAPLFLVEHYTERVAEVTLSAESIVKILALGGAGHMNMLVHLNQQGEVHLSAEQLITVTRLYIEKNGDLNNWTADEVKRRLLQNQLAAVACGWRTDDAEQKIVLEQLVAAGLIDEANARPSQTMPMEVEQRLLAALLRYR